jgi:hypothetical protein
MTIRVMQTHRRPMVALLVALGLASAGCKQLDASRPTPATPSPGPRATAQPAAGGEASTPDCPQDLSVALAVRTLDTRHGPHLPRAKYKTMRWASEHRNEPAASFGVAAAVAIDRIVEIERQHPELIPAGFRAAVAAAPRDPALRVRMARCELADRFTRRRASYDAALAMLLGDRSSAVHEVFEEATVYQGGRGATTSSCHKTEDCPADSACEARDSICYSPARLALTFIAPDERDVEDVLSRALLQASKQGGDAPVSEPDLLHWAAVRIHVCGSDRKQLCNLTRYEKRGHVTLVHWDLRDGGTGGESSDPTAGERLQDRMLLCYDRTGFTSQSMCLRTCDVFTRGHDCRSECFNACDGLP